jgi:repressor LexA
VYNIKHGGAEMNFSTRLKFLRNEHGLTQKELSDKLSELLPDGINISKSSISMWEIDERTPELETFELLADFFNVDMDYLKGKSDIERKSSLYFLSDTETRKTVRVNIYGKIPAGMPKEASEEIIGEEDIPKEWTKGGQEYIALKVTGDSMYPKYLNDDIIILRLQNDCESGQDAVVYVDGYDATLKTVIKHCKKITA